MKKLKIDDKYHEQNKARAQDRLQKVVKQSKYKINNKLRMIAMKHNINNNESTQHAYQQRLKVLANNYRQGFKQLKNRKKYWMRRSKLLSMARIQQSTLHKQRKMSSTSQVNLLDVRLMFRKAEHRIHRAQLKVKQLHTLLTEQADECLKHIPTDRTPMETDIDLAFDELRQRSSSGEMYFWELSYKTLSEISDQPITIDEEGRAHIFEPINVHEPLVGFTVEPVAPSIANPASVPPTSVMIKNWYCNTHLCTLTDDSIQDTVNLLLKVTSANPLKIAECYLHMDGCSNENSDRLGHSVHCSSTNGCQSLLRPARTLSTQYPRLRGMIRRLYEVRQLI